METSALLSIFAVSLPLGMTHALDADHVLAVSSLSSRESRPRGASYAAHWAIGHGGLLLVLAATAFVFHLALPQSIPFWAERLVGLILIATGLALLWTIAQQYRHGGAPALGGNAHGGHAHGDNAHGGHKPPLTMPRSYSHPPLRTPLVIGMVHALAGSAPALALAPAALLDPAMAVLYVGVFSIGVLAGMVTFSMLLGRFQSLLLAKAPAIANAGRTLLGVAAVAVGVFWLVR